jgi:hypothetical protein
MPYFKLAIWDARNVCFRDGKRAYPTEADARADALKPGRYRISRVDDAGRTDLEPFDVGDAAAADNSAPLRRPIIGNRQLCLLLGR